MPQEPRYIQNIRNGLSKSKAFGFTNPPVGKHTKKNSSIDPLLATTYQELKHLLKTDYVSEPHQLVKKNVLEDTCQQIVSFTVKNLGLIIYHFDNDIPEKFWFVPSSYLGYSEVKREVNRFHRALGTFIPVSTVNIHIHKLLRVVDDIDTELLILTQTRNAGVM